MQTTTQCPTIDDLECLAIGAISDEAAVPIERHLLECPACVERMGAIAADDTLLSALKAQSTVKDGPEESEALRQLASRLRELSQVTLSTQLDLTSAPPAGEGGNTASDSAGNVPFLAPAQSPDEIGRLGGYRVLRVLGAGGMGVVFEAEDPKLKRRIALKVMKPDLSANVQSRQRFLREAQTLAALDHDHVVTIYQVREDGGVPFIAMPFLQGESLAERLAKGAGFGIQGSGEDAKTQDQRPKTQDLNPKSKIENH